MAASHENEIVKASDDGALTELSENFICPITRDLMEDPVVAADGFTYEREAIEAWINRPGQRILSPITLLPLGVNGVLIPNTTLRNTIRQYQELRPLVRRRALTNQDLQLAIQLRQEELEEALRKRERQLDEVIEQRDHAQIQLEQVGSLERRNYELATALAMAQKRLIDLENMHRRSGNEIHTSLFNQLSQIIFPKGAERNIPNLYGLAQYRPKYKAGNCLFVGIAEFVADRDARQLRSEMINYIRTDANLIDRLRTLAEAVGDEQNTLRTTQGDISIDRPYHNVERYLEIMAEDQTWGTEIEVVALARMLQRPIVIFTPGNVYDYIVEEEAYLDQEPIFLNYVNQNHYAPLAIPDGFRGRDILPIIREDITNRANRSLLPTSAFTLTDATSFSPTSMDISSEQLVLTDALITACERGDVYMVKELIKLGVDLREPNSEGKLPLGSAIWGCNIALVEFLIEELDDFLTSNYLRLCLEMNKKIYGSIVPEMPRLICNVNHHPIGTTSSPPNGTTLSPP